MYSGMAPRGSGGASVLDMASVERRSELLLALRGVGVAGWGGQCRRVATEDDPARG